MPVPSSGPLSLIFNIANELGISPVEVSLSYVSGFAGKSSPHAMSEFYGYSAGPTYTFYDNGYSFEPCEGSYQLYEGSDGNWYKSFDGGASYTLATGEIYFTFGYFDGGFVYFGYILDFGPSLSFWGDIFSYCGP